VPSGDRERRFREARLDFHRELAGSWPYGLADPYDLLPAVALPRAEIAALWSAGDAIGRIYLKLSRVCPLLPGRVLRSMGHSRVVRRLCLLDRTRFSLGVSRIDVAVTESGIKLLDYNADAPGLIFESAEVNRRACGTGRRTNPNHRTAALLRATLNDHIARFRRRARGRRDRGATVRCVYTRDAWDERTLAEYYSALCSDRFDATSIPLEALKADDRFVYGENGERIDVLIRCTPLSNFLESPWLSVRAGRSILRLAGRGRLCLINPMRAHLMESKGMQALIWGMFERQVFFNRAERSLVERHFLPTYFAPPSHWRRFVEKPLLESRGVGVAVRTRTGRRPVARDGHDSGHIYQQYVPLTQRVLMTESGPRRLTLVVSCVLARGRTIALAMRAGRSVIDERAWIVPVSTAP
jgi:glutathionylspermidine synthase